MNPGVCQFHIRVLGLSMMLTSMKITSLVNSVERHTCCNAAYCLRKKTGQQDLECHFKYPHPISSESDINFERLSDGTICATFTTKRNDPRVNSHNHAKLES